MTDTLMKIKEYYYWDLFLHRKQMPHLGRCYARSRRADLVRVVDMDTLEQTELFGDVFPEWSRITKSLFNYDWPDILMKGSGDPHMYVHLIPRYTSARKGFGLSFQDINPNGAHSSERQRELDMDLLRIIKDTMIKRGKKLREEDQKMAL